MRQGNAPPSPAKQGGCPIPSAASPAKASSPEAQPQVLALQGYLTRQDPKAEPLLCLCEQMLFSSLGQKPSLRNYGLAALFTCNFFHKIVSHNSNSPTLLATDHLSCRQHTGCLNKKLQSSSTKGRGTQGTQGWGAQGKVREAEPFP